ncbi:hypothetical protein [Aeropyrum pernix]|nr:hypothetical protein [Aeropyrum pernix]
MLGGVPTYAQVEDVLEYLGVIDEAVDVRRDVIERMILTAEL